METKYPSRVGGRRGLVPQSGRETKATGTMNATDISSVPSLQFDSNARLRSPRLVNAHSFANASTKEFPPFRLDTVNQCLWRCRDGGEEERIPLKPKAFAILRYLVQQAGRLVTQEELLDAIWPDTHVQPEVLKRHIFDIRNVLGDDPKNPTYIETLSRRGYQFVGNIRCAGSASRGIMEEPLRTRVVGRERELAALRSYLERASAGQRQTVFVTGEAGIGKTTLVDEFQRQTATGTRIRIARGQCVEGFGGKEDYYPVLEALGNLCRGPEGDSVIRILAAHAPSWLVQFPALVNREQRQILEHEMVGGTKQRMLREISDALETITAEQPLMLILEDLNWVDPSTLDLISALARGRSAAKVMVIGTYRPGDVTVSEQPLHSVKQSLLVHRLCHELALEPFGEIEIAAYLAAESPDGSVPNGLATLLYRRSEGNPLFMVAALKHMSQCGYVSEEDGTWKLHVPIEEIDLEVPESLRQMIELQIEHLSEEEHQALEAASVTGVFFSAAASASAASMDVVNFENLCEGLARRHYIVRSAGSKELPDATLSPRYEFVHGLYREVLCRRQSPGRRAKLHVKIGERLEVLYAQQLGEVAPELAHHFEQGGDSARAASYRQLATSPGSGEYAVWHRASEHRRPSRSWEHGAASATSGVNYIAVDEAAPFD